MMKSLLVGLLAFSTPLIYAADGESREHLDATAEEAPYLLGRNVVSGELLGRAGAYGVYYDRMLTNRLALGLGFSSYGRNDELSSLRVTMLPLYANYYFQGGSHRGFATAGADIVRTQFQHYSDKITRTEIFGHSYSGREGTDTSFLPVLGAGYEYRSTSGFLFRGALYEIFAQRAFTWGGLSFGAAF